MNVAELKAAVEALEKDDLAWNKEKKDFDDIKVHPTVFMDGDVVRVSGEDGLGFIDYYGEFHGGCSYIHPVLEEFAKSVGGFWEWRDAACIGLYF